MPGRKRKPTYLHLIDKTFNVTAHRERIKEPRPTGNLAAPPNWFNESQRIEWNYVIKNAPLGMLKKLDRATLVSLVVSSCLHRQAVEKLNAMGESGLLYRQPTTGAWIQSPLINTINKQALIMLRSAAELGFTPASRSKVQIEAENQASNPKDRFFAA